MDWKGLNELRELFIDFFEKKNHMHLESFSLVPEQDGSLLFINSGMAPMKKWFLGQKKPPCERVVTVQKCIRTGDLERVGKTARHGTFFEMLGNFSFGDYFKREAIFYSWEFVFNVLKMPKEKLYITTYEKDYEAYLIWKDEIGVSKDNIFRLGKEDNFWEIGLGPCGPCSEIYFDRGEKYGCGKKNCAPGCECDRFVEFWNLVFSQYDNKGDGKYEEMVNKNIDTGMGLERLAAIFQGVDSLFEVDTIKKILDEVSKLANYCYGKDKEKDENIRIITDHIRSIVFLIGDGVIPSNEGRGYVLRRLIRRAKKSGKKLKIYGLFLKKLVGVVAFENAKYYPKLKTNIEYIRKVVDGEEISFEKILEATEEKAYLLFYNLKKERVNSLYKGLNEFILKEKANLLAFEEEIYSFLSRVEIEFERFFNLFSGGTIDDYSFGLFEEKKETIKKEVYYYYDKIKDIFSVFCYLANEEYVKKETWQNFEKDIEYFFKSSDIKNIDETYIIDSKNKLKNIIDFFYEKIKVAIKKFEEIFVDFYNEKETYYETFENKEDIEEKEEELKIYIKKLFSFKEALGCEMGESFGNFFEKDSVLLGADDAFKLCDTYGLPFDILKDMAEEEGVELDEKGFLKLLNEQKQRSKENAQFKGIGWNEKEGSYIKNLPKTEFIGYEKLECDAKILYIAEKKGERFDVIFDRTPFYAVGGGQKADVGDIIDFKTKAVLGFVEDVKKTDYSQYMHTIKFFKDIPLVGDVCFLKVDEVKRRGAEKNHTAAHILHRVLKNIFGDNVNQAGQYVDDKRLRFDFNSFEALGKENIKKIEDSVNDVILKGLDVNISSMPIEKAKEKGAVALFSEKYGDVVRVVDIFGFSSELCAGTHVRNTREIGAFKILAESSVGAGIRRIEAITAKELVFYSSELEEILNNFCEIFKTNDFETLPSRALSLQENYKKVVNELDDIKLKICEKEFEKAVLNNSKKTNSFLAVVFEEEILDKKQLNLFADRIKKKYNNLVALIFASFGEKRNIVVVCGDNAVKNKADAANIIRRLAAVSGIKGGGKKDFAVAGGLTNCKDSVLQEEFFRIIKELEE